MQRRRLGRTGVSVSRLGLGGHEFLPDGRSKGFNEDFRRAVTAGVIFEGFDTPKRRAVMRAAHACGIDFFDATIDAEKSALGAGLRDEPPPREVVVQTRPEGMVYTNNPDNPWNWMLTDLDRLRGEVVRITGLLGRPRVDILNFGFVGEALDRDPGYLDRLGSNIGELKASGLVRFASADTFSGESVYLRQMRSGVFDSIFVNFNFADDGPERRVLPAAGALGLGVVTREAFMKGALFRMGEEAGIRDRNALARAALKWVLAHEEVTTVVVGIDGPAQLAESLAALEEGALTPPEGELLEAVRKTPSFREYHAARREAFVKERA